MLKLVDKSKNTRPYPHLDSVNIYQSDGTMRKYQQLALTITAAVSLIGFLFYKHEYERLRYTLEYLDTFGQPRPGEEPMVPHCGYRTIHKVTTPPADWTQITSDLEVYSAFFDNNGIGEAHIRSIGVISKSKENPSNLECLVWFESEVTPVHGSCAVESARDRLHGHVTHDEDVEVLYIICTIDNKKLIVSKTPYLIQFMVDGLEPSKPVFIHESDSWKSVSDKSAVCVIPVEPPITSLGIIEFIAYYNIIGVDKFTIYGPVLTPLARKLLDKYGDESGIDYEEKQFTSSKTFQLSSNVIRKVIELDCLYRHRDTHENIIIVDFTQYIILDFRPTLQETLDYAIGSKKREIATFHLTSQLVCIDKMHAKLNTLQLSQQTHKIGELKEMGIAVLRPHLLAGAPINVGSSNNQHVSAANAVVYHYTTCSDHDSHDDIHHLPTKNKLVEKVKKSLLYRKWIIYSP